DRLLLIQSGADNEGKSETLAVLTIVFSELFCFLRGRIKKIGARLFAFRRRGELIIADQIGMRPDETNFFILAGFLDRGGQRGVQRFARQKRALVCSAGGDPGRVLENGPDDADELHPIHRIQLGQLWHRLVGVNELIVRRNGETEWSSLRQGAGAGAEDFARRASSYAEGPRSRRALERRFRIFLHQRRQHEGGGDRYD